LLLSQPGPARPTAPRQTSSIRRGGLPHFFSLLPDTWRELLDRAAPLRDIGEIRLAIPQDEFLRPELLCEFVNEFEIGHVFSAAPASEWPKIYSTVDRDRVSFETVLTGYLDPGSTKRAERVAASVPERETDIGYRAWHAAPWLGRHGRLKHQVADAVRERAPRHGLTVDISTRTEDTLFADDWYRFLASCRYTIGVEGGSSLLDRDGTIKEATERYVAEHPAAGFEEIEAACFPGKDGSLRLFAVSPRHLEACVTRTCQVLVEGDYNGVLRPGEHYIELRRDLSNLEQVLEELVRDQDRERIVEAAYQDVVASGRYTYESLVRTVEASLPGRERAARPAGRLTHALGIARDRATWSRLRLRAARQRVEVSLARLVKRLLPGRAVELIRRGLGRGRLT
jgi:hypothetical protein